jgi:hypothetical protein
VEVAVVAVEVEAEATGLYLDVKVEVEELESHLVRSVHLCQWEIEAEVHFRDD